MKITSLNGTRALAFRNSSYQFVSWIALYPTRKHLRLFPLPDTILHASRNITKIEGMYKKYTTVYTYHGIISYEIKIHFWIPGSIEFLSQLVWFLWLTESKLPTRTSKQKARIAIQENIICYHWLNNLSKFNLYISSIFLPDSNLTDQQHCIYYTFNTIQIWIIEVRSM